MDHQRAKRKQQLRRRLHARNKIRGSSERPRLTVFRSCKHIYAQIIDDTKGHTLVSVSSLSKNGNGDKSSGGNVNAAVVVGKSIAEKAKEKGIEKVAFDRGHYKFHGRIKALAEAAREGGLQF